jgi:uncharacterized delta-60 repeat protein
MLLSKSMRMSCLLGMLGGTLFSAGCDDDSTNTQTFDAAATGDAASGSADASVAGDASSNADAAVGTDTAAGGDGGVASSDARDGAAGETGPAPAVDTDLVLARFLADGKPDPTFGTNGVARIDLGPGLGTTRDSLWNVARDAQDRLLLFGAKKADGTRVDSDRVIVRLTANGMLDETFATKGVFTVNIANLSDSARAGTVQADGKIVSAGYTSQPSGVGTQSVNKIVLVRLNADGTPDNTFGVMGIVNSAPLMSSDPTTIPWGFSEAYGMAIQSNGNYVTAGYGRSFDSPGTTVNMLSFRYSPAGKLDSTWNNNTGLVQLDIAGDNDRGRAVVALPGDRILIAGSHGPMPMVVKPMVVILTAGGVLDTTFDTDGYKLYDFERADSAFYGAATAGTTAAVVGYRAGNMEDDDALLAILPIGGAGTEFAKAVPLSETTNDRFWGVTFDAAGKIVAAGFVAEAGDNRLAVARFNADGTPDATFAGTGVAKLNVATAGTAEEARSVVLQSDGKIVIAGTVEH